MMRAFRLFAAALLLVPLASCAPMAAVAAGAAGLPTAPVQVCDKSTMDEQAGTGVELGYKAWRIAMKLGIRTGVIHGALATKIAGIDNQLFAGTGAVQNAYAACNAASYKAAIDHFHALLREGNAALGN